MIDPKPDPRVRNPELLGELHRRWRECFVCEKINLPRYSIHHVHKHPRNDVEANLVLLCGDGTSGCHGDVEHARYGIRSILVSKLRVYRPDVFGYLHRTLGSAIAADQWLRSYAEGKLD